VTRTASGATVLTRRVLNRTTLRRQALLEQSAMPTLEMVGHLVAGQGPEPGAPYLGLWIRREGLATTSSSGCWPSPRWHLPRPPLRATAVTNRLQQPGRQ
jgi:hypothetical protein